ncbi:thiamine pyrophosphate-binding protein [Paenibacillus sp. Leaf72]|uniref:thiamine pyrophosphate-binding protein n=1 Tax=Paenibacillus sp. Leaf72 TaxID=1736234 RepID=UPI0006F6CB2C|nr:thiamine pyrophosphate-binding protein [Paenibacillus sp. Leaf72]KQN99994.1 hypothetical protein ASF12_17615 [Paenibacillus sp. Leaf72]
MRAIEAGLRFLIKQGVKYIFGIPAGSINALYDCLYDLPELQAVVAKHETSSGYMAAAYTRITGIPAVCVGSSGPGATNLVTPAASAWKEKLPVIFLTGSVPSTKLGKGGAQELGADPIFAPVTKLSRMVTNAEELPAAIAEAYWTAISGVPGPVHLSIPIDLQMADIGEMVLPQLPLIQEQMEPVNKVLINAALQAVLQVGERGAILLGHGAKSAPAEVLQFAERAGWMVATTPRGKGAFPENHPQSLGVYGLAGNDKAVEFLNSDGHKLLLVLGSSLGELATCNWEARLAAGKQLIHVDYDERELGRCYEADIALHGEIADVLRELSAGLAHAGSGLTAERKMLLEQLHLARLEAAADASAMETWNTRTAIRLLGANAPEQTRFYIDIGEFMTYSIQNLLIREQQQFDININFGGMGSGIAGSLGAKLAEPDRPVLCITGDGCFFMHGLEVMTAKEYGLPIVFVVINNARLGMVYHGHMLQYERCLSDFSQQRVSIAAVAQSLGIRHVQVESTEQLQAEHVQQWFAEGKSGPIVVEIIVDGNEIPPMGERVKFLQGATY